MNNQPIGILDSGVGGLSIWKAIINYLPHESTIYLADSKNCPYGEKTPQEIYQLARTLITFLLQQKVKMIVIACNTITVLCLDKLRQEFAIPLIGTIPVVKTAAEKTRTKQMGILSTSQTAKALYQKKLIERFAPNCQVCNIGTNSLVPFIEAGETSSLGFKQQLFQVLQIFKDQAVDTLVLGCTHFPFIAKQIQSILGSQVLLLDSAGAISRQVKKVLAQNLDLALGKASHVVYTTGEQTVCKQTIQKLLPSRDFAKINSLERINLDA